MDFIEHFLVLKRKISVLIVTVLACVLLAVIYCASFVPGYDSTVHMTFSIEDAQQAQDYMYSNFYAEQSALEFTRTISGWYKDPFFQDHVFRVAEVPFAGEVTLMSKIFGFFSAKRVERQNIATTFSASSETNARKINDGLKKVIQHRLEAYNTASKSKYAIAYDSAWVERERTPWGLSLIAALLFGSVLGILLIYILDLFCGTVTTSRQVGEVFGKTPFDIVRLKSSKDQRYFRMRMLEEKPFKAALAASPNHGIFAGLGLDLYHFPNDVAQLKDFHGNLLVSIQLGATLKKDLLRLSRFLEGKKWEYVVVQ